MINENDVGNIDRLFSFIKSDFITMMDDFRRKLIRECKHCKMFQDDLVKANVMSTLPEIIRKNWTDHVKEVHLNV